MQANWNFGALAVDVPEEPEGVVVPMGPAALLGTLPAGRRNGSPRAAPKTLLVEDHAMVRESLLLLLDQRLPGHLWRAAAKLAAALRLLHNEPDIKLLLLDLDLPDSRGLDTLQRVRDAAPQVPVVVLSAHDDRSSVLAAIDHGAAGFVSKTVDAARLVEGVQCALEDGVVVPAAMSRAVPASGGVPELSERERDVLRLLIEGRSNKLIARALGLTGATVRTHLQMVHRKLQVESRTSWTTAISFRWTAKTLSTQGAAASTCAAPVRCSVL